MTTAIFDIVGSLKQIICIISNEIWKFIEIQCWKYPADGELIFKLAATLLLLC